MDESFKPSTSYLSYATPPTPEDAMHLTRVGAAFFITTLCFPASAQTIDACVKNDGSLRIVSSPTDCRSKESPISWNANGSEGPQGPIGEPGPAGEQGPPGDNLRVVDANGVDLGPLVGFHNHDAGYYVAVYVAEVEAIIELVLDTGRMGYAGNYHQTRLYFAELGCQGPAYTPMNHAGIVIPATIDTVTRYFVGRPGPLTNITIQAKSEATAICSRSSGAGSFLLAEEVTDRFDLTFPVPLPITVVSGEN